MEVEYSEETGLIIGGFRCEKGAEYGKNEFCIPKRIFTSSIKISGANRRMLPIRSNRPVPKEKLMDCMKEIRKISLNAPILEKQVIIPDILHTGADIIASMTLEREK
jgi:CxxC motif-containing protein